MSKDIGERTVQAVWDVLQVDDEWAVPLARGFRWWAHDVAQEVVALPPGAWPDGTPYAQVVVRTPLLSRPAADAATTARAIAEMNGRATGGAFRRAGDGTIIHELAATTSNETLGGVGRLLATGAILALTEGVEAAEAYAGVLGSQLLRSAHPEQGRRLWPDDILNVTDQLILPLGEEPSRWADAAPTLAAVALAFNERLIGFAADVECEHGLLCEFGLGDHETSLALVMPTRDDGGLDAAPGLPRATADPRLGAGIVGWVLLPMDVDIADAFDMAALLNDREGNAGPGAGYRGAHLGAWTVWDPDGRPTVAYRVFLPNLLADIVEADALAHHVRIRAGLASEVLFPDQAPLMGPALGDLLMRRVETFAANPGQPAEQQS